MVKNPKSNGSQLAKVLNLPRTSVYSALDNLYQRGAVFLLAKQKTKTYVAVAPIEFLRKLKDDYLNTVDYLEEEFKKIEVREENRNYMNIEGKENCIKQVKEMLNVATKEVYLNTNYSLELFIEELKEIEDREVRVILFSFEELDTLNLAIDFYHHNNKQVCLEDKRIMLVVDQKQVLIASEDKSGNLVGTFTENPLLVSIISEHIHHDIYLLKLQERYGEDLIDKNIKLNSIFERSSMICSKD